MCRSHASAVEDRFWSDGDAGSVGVMTAGWALCPAQIGDPAVG